MEIYGQSSYGKDWFEISNLIKSNQGGISL